MSRSIIFLHSHLLKPGGASKVVLEQASRLTKNGFSSSIITTTANPKITHQYKDIKIICLGDIPTSNLNFWLTFPVFFRKLVRILNSIPNKIVYCHSLAIYWGYTYKLFYPQTKLIIYFHDLGFPYFDSKTETNSLSFGPRIIIKTIKPIFNLINHRIIKSANKIIANSLTSANFIKNHYHRSADIIITPGVDLKKFKPSLIKSNYIIAVGRLEKIKNFETTIKGFGLYVQQNPKTKTKLLIIGEGPEKKSLIELVKKIKIINRVKFLPNQTTDQLAKLYRHADLGIFMSPFESFGLTAIECLASGTPTLGVNQNGIKEIISRFNKRYLVSNNPDNLANKICQLLLPSHDSKTISQATSSVKTYSWVNQITLLTSWFKLQK